MLDIFQNIHILYLRYGVLRSSGYGVLGFIPLWSLLKYATEILERAGMVSCNPSRTPVDTEYKLGDDGYPVCLFMHDPWEPHFPAFKRILWYVRDTSDYGL
ncbi:ribonuclease H-like domain-containing protein [Tanacetum coccineum]